MKGYEVHKIDIEQCRPWFLLRHYARRMAPVTYGFGLYCGTRMVGVCTFHTGIPPLRKGLCGEQYESEVYELNRLCVSDQTPNILSWFVAECLRQLPPMIVVSFADSSQGHHGYIYQATNWIYTGLSAIRSDYKIEGREDKHNRNIHKGRKPTEEKKQFLQNKYGVDVKIQARPRKHRYVYFVGSKTQRKRWRKALRYSVEPYPKGDNSRYTEAPIYSQAQLF